ncbi:MAG: hypothetical protein CMI17_08655 [Opitutaceae bacterium]|nr:hypothetical protein [Opitutaceae bacterium]
MKSNLLNQPIQTRFLEKGYLTITSIRRQYLKNKYENPSGFYDTIDDAAMIVEKEKTLPRVDPDRVVLYGGSGERFWQSPPHQRWSSPAERARHFYAETPDS